MTIMPMVWKLILIHSWMESGANKYTNNCQVESSCILLEVSSRTTIFKQIQQQVHWPDLLTICPGIITGTLYFSMHKQPISWISFTSYLGVYCSFDRKTYTWSSPKSSHSWNPADFMKSVKSGGFQVKSTLNLIKSEEFLLKHLIL